MAKLRNAYTSINSATALESAANAIRLQQNC